MAICSSASGRAANRSSRGLWATRRIGELLNTIRLNGENRELVDSIVNLSVRYGIITPYTSFLIDENDILSQSGRDQAANSLTDTTRSLSQQSSGAAAVGAADTFGEMEAAAAPMALPMPTMTAAGTLAPGAITPNIAMGGGDAGYAQAEQVNPIQSVGDKTFLLQDGVWTDTTFDPDTMDDRKSCLPQRRILRAAG